MASVSRPLGLHGGDGGNFALDHAAGADQLQRAPFVGGIGNPRGGLCRAGRAVLCTYTPEPVRTSTQPSTSSAISASRTEGRLTPSCLARSRSAGNRVSRPANSPAAISAAQLLGDLPVQALGFDGLQGHGEVEGKGLRVSQNWPSGQTNLECHELHKTPSGKTLNGTPDTRRHP
jgi:hypothetical protein